MYHRGMDWDKYAMHQDFSDMNVRVSLENQTNQITWSQDRLAKSMTDAIQQQSGATTRQLGRGFNSLIASQRQMNDILLAAGQATSYQLDRVHGSIEQLRADFDWGLSAVLWKLEMQNDHLKSIVETLQTPLDTQAKELRKRAEYAYTQGWYDEALNDFLESERKNYQDFAVHQAIGNIYLYRRQPVNLDAAREYYLKAGKYAEPQSKYHAALGYLHAGFVCYLQEDDTAAITHARQATELYPDLTEAWYNLAKFAAAARQPDSAIPALEHALLVDHKYVLKMYIDDDFASIEAAVTSLMERLRDGAKQIAEQQWLPLLAEIQRAAFSEEDSRELTRAMAEVETRMAEHTYLGYYEVVPLIEVCRNVKDETQQAVRERQQREERERQQREERERQQHKEHIIRLQTELADYIVPTDLDYLPRLLSDFEQQSAPASTPVAKVIQKVEQWVAGRTTTPLWIEIATLTKHTDEVTSVAFSPDGTILASASADKKVCLWDVRSRQPLTTLIGHSKTVTSVAFSPDGQLLASASKDKTVRLWDAKTCQEVTTLTGHVSGVTSVAFSPNSSIFLASVADCSVQLWNIATRKQHKQRTVLGEERLFSRPVAFNPDGSILAYVSDDTVRLWNISYKQPTNLTDCSEGVRSLAFNPDGSILASASYNNRVRLWDIRTRRELATLKGYIVTFSPDGTILASASRYCHVVDLWDISTRQELTTLTGHSKDVTSVAFSPDGRLLASASEDKTVRLWSPVLYKRDWERMERERQQQEWREAGQCEECGEKLGWWDKLCGQTRCKRHR